MYQYDDSMDLHAPVSSTFSPGACAICAIVCLVKVEGNHKPLQEHATQNPEILGTKKNSTRKMVVAIFQGWGSLARKVLIKLIINEWTKM